MSEKLFTNDIDYDFFLSEWVKARDFVHSEKMVKSKGDIYVPRLNGQDDNEYKSYISYGGLSMYMKKGLFTYIGMVMRKKYTLTLPASENTDITELQRYPVLPNNQDLDGLVYQVLYNRFLYGRIGMLVDYVDKDSRSYIMLYDTFSILSTSYDKYGILNEVWLKDGNNTLRLYIRDNIYMQDVFDEDDVLIDSIRPIKNGEYFDYIPFIITGDYIPFLIEILDLNLHHYKLSVDLCYALHWVGIPTPVVTGIQNEEDIPDFIGVSRYINIPDPQGRAFFMEFEGKGLDSIVERMKVIEEDISKLTVNMILSDVGMSTKTATQSLIDYNSSVSSLTGVVNNIGNDITTAFNIMMDWNTMKTDYHISLNTDFVSKKMEPQMLRELTNMLLSNTISYDTYWQALQDGEMVNDNKSSKDELTDIKNNITL
jgi:hypothetical protein